MCQKRRCTSRRSKHGYLERFKTGNALRDFILVSYTEYKLLLVYKKRSTGNKLYCVQANIVNV